MIKIKLILAGLLLTSLFAYSQNKPNLYFSDKAGIGIANRDSTFATNIRFRMQNRFLYESMSLEDFNPELFEARVRRLRLRFDGWVYSRKFTYNIQLSFSKGDMDWDMNEISKYNNSPNVVRDAIFYYKPNSNFQIGLGQTKLPGNRQRVVSSGQLQFYDRSIVNANFTLDRDFGFFSQYSNKIGSEFRYYFKGAVTSGEGRNVTKVNQGLAYTGRAEILPLGDFTNGGDYFEGDVEREQKPKISIGATYQFNDLAVRSQGQLGKDLYAPLSFQSKMVDFLFKYKGFAFSAEYLLRELTDKNKTPITTEGAKQRFMVVGEGTNAQLSYCFKNHIELAARYSVVNPSARIFAYINKIEESGIGITKYFVNHRFKLQGNVFYHTEQNKITGKSTNDHFIGVVQVEIGI